MDAAELFSPYKRVNLNGKELYRSDASSGSCAEELKNPSRGVESTGQSSKVARLSCGTFFILNHAQPSGERGTVAA